jgi:pimeloyl-ACP methyl ester carboxylesterase
MMRLGSRRGRLLIAVASLVLLGGATVACAHVSAPSASPDSGRHGWSVSVNGRTLYIECQGTGSPAVILDAGLGGSSTVWDDVILSAEDTKVRMCTYDRWGQGRSGTNPAGSRPIGDATTDLHALLAAAGVAPPYVLVSHSIAGIIHRDFTKRYPAEVAGLVMVDTAPDDWNLYEKLDEFTSAGETLDIASVAASLRKGDDLGHRPVVVIVGGTSDYIHRGSSFRDYWVAAQHAIAARSTDSMVVVAVNSDHDVPAIQPDLVSTAIGLVVAAVTTGQPMTACDASPRLAEHGGRCDPAARD